MADFKINQEYIAKVLCINKDEPQKGCNGQCHLSKQMKKTEEKEQKQTPIPINQKQDVVFFIDAIIQINLTNTIERAKPLFEYNKGFYNSLFIHKIFHPPKRYDLPTLI